MESQTRVEKYKQLREQIAAMDDTNRIVTPYLVPEENKDVVKKEDNVDKIKDEVVEESKVKPNTRSIPLTEIFKAHDQYTSLVSQDEIEKKKREEEYQRRLDLRNKIILISIFSLAFLGFIILLIYFILN